MSSDKSDGITVERVQELIDDTFEYVKKYVEKNDIAGYFLEKRRYCSLKAALYFQKADECKSDELRKVYNEVGNAWLDQEYSLSMIFEKKQRRRKMTKYWENMRKR